MAVATWVIETQELGLQAIDETSTTQKHDLGKRVRARHATNGHQTEFVYLVGVASTAAGDWVTINYDDGSTTLLVADAKGPVGIAMSANVASQYGWYAISGKVPAGTCEASFADNGDVYATSVAGSVDDAVVAGDLVFGAKGASARDTDTGAAEFEIQYPFTKDGLDDAT